MSGVSDGTLCSTGGHNATLQAPGLVSGAGTIQHTSHEPLLRLLNTPPVRDLVWACFSPPLLDSSVFDDSPPLRNSRFELSPARQAWLLQLDRQPRALLDYLGDAREGRLGLYFERLWQFFLKHDSGVTLLAHNLPVRDATHTVGEFDVIYFCHQRRRHVHLELAVKFYLQRRGADSEWHNWLGPDSRDRLDRKIGRMRQHQLRLSDTAAGRETLAQLEVAGVLREMEVKGRLFRHAGEPGIAPPAASTGLELQQWLYRSELQTLLETGQRYAPLSRRDWLAPVMASTHPPVSASELCDEVNRQLANRSRPLQIAAFNESREGGRCFVVPDDWPRERDESG